MPLRLTMRAEIRGADYNLRHLRIHTASIGRMFYMPNDEPSTL